MSEKRVGNSNAAFGCDCRFPDQPIGNRQSSIHLSFTHKFTRERTRLRKQLLT